MLHSHLPYYRKAGMWPFGEESFYECMAETYIPLLNIVAELWDEGIAAKLTVGITPILAEQMADPHLNAGFDAFLRTRIQAAREDEVRYSPRGESPNPDLLHLARFYLNWFQQILDDYHNKWQRDVIGGYRKYQDLGAIEITTSAATHCFSPLLETDSSLHCQFKTGADSYKRHFGRAPRGIWLPECAYRPAKGSRPPLEKWLYDEGLKYFFTESFAIKGGQTVELRRDFGPYGSIKYIPVAARPETGLDVFEAYYLKDYPVAVLGRHEKAGYQVWSAEHGYPGDGNYREFHKKDDRSGLHYWKLTSKTTDLGAKELYNPESAAVRMRENSDHYVGVVQQLLTDHLRATGEPGMLMVSFDTELFGHWWFEGIAWIKEVIRKLRTYTAVTMRTAGEYIESCPPKRAIELPESSWGAGGHWQVWLNNDTEWMWPIIHSAERDMERIAVEYKDADGGLVGRALKQAARELLLLQSSDWPFLVTTGQAKQYAVERFKGHHDRFRELVAMVLSGSVNEGRLSEFEDLDNPFPDVCHRCFLPAG
ncbi:MAG TPA: 1,4-alpha-glucan branching protein domain-containing protein [Candidatus Obscuribacterales bacterium]